MPLRAMAFHESISVERLNNLFRSDWNQLFAGTTAGHCSRCGAQFAVFFPNSDDRDNGEYLASIEKLISEDCKAGKHSREFVLKAK